MHPLLSTCAYISSRSKWVLNSEGVPNNEYNCALLSIKHSKPCYNYYVYMLFVANASYISPI